MRTHEDGYIWTLFRDHSYRSKYTINNSRRFLRDSEEIFNTVDDALEDGIDELIYNCPDEGSFRIIVTRVGDSIDNYRLEKGFAYKDKIRKRRCFRIFYCNFILFII